MEAIKSSAVFGSMQPLELVKEVTWGRASKARWTTSLGAVFMICVAPVGIYLNWVALKYFDGSLGNTILTSLEFDSPLDFIGYYCPRPSLVATLLYAGWIAWQALLYAYLPGEKCLGQRTPGGNLLEYTTNGLAAWGITHMAFLTAAMLGVIDPAVIAKNWDGLFCVANVFGVVVGLFAQCKGYWFPTYPEDCKKSGSWVFDFWGGVELNPRIGKTFDLKFFFNGRPGMVAWTLINLSFAAYQRQQLGYVTSSMMVVLALQTIYVVDFLINESWYTRTIDISHDHFGFMLAWGDTTFLPNFYTLQAQYLARYPTHLSNTHAITILTIGLCGYGIFRWANYERDHVRSKKGEAIIWGRPAEFIPVTYRTTDGQEHKSILITSGWWGLCRHTNYVADLILSAAYCATCGFTHVLPWSYFFFMCVLLNHRAGRDEQRCSSKYGEKWDEYCEKVRYRFVPGVY